MASLLSAVKSKAKRNHIISTNTTTNRGRLSSYSSEDSTNHNGDSSTTSSYNSGNQSPIAMTNYQKLSSSTEEEEDINNNNINTSISKDNDDSTTLTPIQNVYNNPNRFIMNDKQQQQQVATDDNVGGSVAKKRGTKTAAQRHFNSSSIAKQQPSSTAAKQKVRNNNNRRVPRGRNSNRRRGTNSRKSSPTHKDDDDDLIIKTAVAIDNYVAEANCSPTGIENIKQSTKKFGFKLFKEALSCYDDVTTPHNDESRLRSKGNNYFDNVEDDIEEVSQKLFPDGNELDSYAGTSVTSSKSFLDRAHPSVRGRSRKDRRLQELETRSVTSIHTTNTISSLNNLCGANIDLSILEEALDITSNEIEQLQSKSMMEHIQSKSSKLKNVDQLLVCNGGGGCDMANVNDYDNEHDDRVNRLKSLTKKFSKTQKNMKKSSIPVSKKDTPTKQKAAVVLEKMTKGEEVKKLDESLDFTMAVEEKKELDKSLDWLDVEDVSFFDVGTNVFSGSGGMNEGEEVQL